MSESGRVKFSIKIPRVGANKKHWNIIKGKPKNTKNVESFKNNKEDNKRNNQICTKKILVKIFLVTRDNKNRILNLNNNMKNLFKEIHFGKIKEFNNQ